MDLIHDSTLFFETVTEGPEKTENEPLHVILFSGRRERPRREWERPKLGVISPRLILVSIAQFSIYLVGNMIISAVKIASAENSLF